MSPCNNTVKHWQQAPRTSEAQVAPQQRKRKVIMHLALDATSSMGPYLLALVRALMFFVERLMNSNLEPLFSLTIFRDELCGEPTITYPVGTPPEEIKRLLSVVEVQGGGDEPESDLPAINKTLDLSAGMTLPKVLFLLTDASCHDPESGISSSAIHARLTAEQVLFFACSPPIRPYTDFANATGGMLFPIKDKMDVDAFKAILSSLTATTVRTLRKIEDDRLMAGLAENLKTKLMR